MFPEDPQDPELGTEAEELLTHWPLSDKSPAEWEDLAARIDARIRITEVGSTPDYLLDAPLLEEQDLMRRSYPRMKRPSEGSLTALAKASITEDDAHQETEREALARSLLSLAVKARTEAPSPAERGDENTALGENTALAENENDTAPIDNSARAHSAVLSNLVNGPSMQFLAVRQPTVPAASVVADSSEARAASSASTSGNARTGRERGTMWFGIAFGLLGMAAAGVMYVASARQPSAPALAESAALAAPVPVPAKTELPAPPRPAAPLAERDVVKVEEVPLADAGATRAPALSRNRTALERSGARAPAAPAPATARDTGEAPAVKPPAGPSEPGMVMADSLGALPDHPSTGAVQAAVGTVMGAARACVAGQAAPSRATLNFGSDGRVQSVVVTGPAQATSAEACVRSALSGARVRPFARPGYSVTLTVRP